MASGARSGLKRLVMGRKREKSSVAKWPAEPVRACCQAASTAWLNSLRCPFGIETQPVRGHWDARHEVEKALSSVKGLLTCLQD